MYPYNKIFQSIVLVLIMLSLTGCQKIADLVDDNPDIEPLKQGFKTSAAIGYCVSLAATVFKGGPVPENVLFESISSGEYSNAGIMYVTVDDNNPLPFNNRIGDIVIAGIWDNDNYGHTSAGVLSIIFSDLNLFGAAFKFYGIHTVPVMEDLETGNITAVFARQDIVIGEGSDTLLNLSLSNPQFNLEIARLNEEQPDDVFAAVSQNIWFVNIDQNNTSTIYDDSFVVNGGGQIAEASSSSAGIQYHAMIETEFIYDQCSENPVRGDAFIQNLKVGSDIDLGTIYLQFHDGCDGKAYVELSTGKYLKYLGRHVNLNFN
ncbi:hypothetical protein ES705_23205 [subsurface metagenome]